MAKKKKGASAGSGAAAVKGKRSAAAKNASAAPPSARVLVGATDAVVSVPLADGAEATVGALRAGVIAAAALDAGDTAWVLRWHDADALRRGAATPSSLPSLDDDGASLEAALGEQRAARALAPAAAGDDAPPWLRVDAPRDPDAPREVPFASRTEARVAHILLKHVECAGNVSRRTGDESQLSKAEATAELEALRARIVADDDPVAAFGRAARARSDCASFEHDGDLGNRVRGKMNKEFEAAIFALAIDELSGVVDTEVGVHIVQRRPLE